MKKTLAIIFLFLGIYSFAQQKYQSLLWKISGNELTKDSYLYGTMHVSSKVAFRLDDVFYESLMKSDIVALESDPSMWLSNSYENLNSMSSYYTNNGNGNFYENLFQLNQPNDFAIRSFIRFDNSIINSYLYRKNNGTDNFEEETYLDMFIYQAGKKQQKQIVGLEDFNESRYLTTKASYNPVKKKLDIWLRKKYKDGGGFMLTEDAYRSRNLDLLDSIGQASNTEHFRKYMLYERNANMVEVLDSIMQKNAVFSGVGAAHLPGDNGMIEMLRAKGYVVTPLTSSQSSYGKSIKGEIEATFIMPALETYATDDEFLSIKSFEELRELNFYGQKYYVATDMANGAYLAITRINTFENLDKNPKDYLKIIDDLLFEDIPGDIISQEKVETPYPGIKILNKTKKEDYQRYLIYQTPLEIIILKLGGKKDYVLKYGDEIFDSVQFKTKASEIIELSPDFSKYSVELPANYIAENMNMAGKRLIQSYDDDDGYYFLKESPIHDTNYIEEDAFEARYITESFLKKKGLEEIINSSISEPDASAIAMAVIDSFTNQKIHLKSIVKDEMYYLLGYVGRDSLKATKYFNSITFKDVHYKDPFKEVVDTSLHFSVITNAKLPRYNQFYQKRKIKAYEEQKKNIRYVSKTNEVVDVNRTKYHDLQMISHIDSLWSDIHKKYEKNFIISDERKISKNAIFSYEFNAGDSLSSKQIRVKNILYKGTLFVLKTLENEGTESSGFIQKFFTTFKPIDTLLGVTPFEDKTVQFFDALKKNDSIVYKAYTKIAFTNKDAGVLMNTISNHTFKKDQHHIKGHLIKELIKLDDKRIRPFLKSVYIKSYTEPDNQISILEGLIAKNKLSYNDFVLELLAIDFPITSYSLNTVFNQSPKRDSLELKRNLFPEILAYSSVQEYKRPIYLLLSKLNKENLAKPKLYKKYKDQIFNDAKIELKRSLTNDRNTYRYNDSRKVTNSFLDAYVTLLFPFREEKRIHSFFEKLIEGNDTKALVEYYYLLKQQKIEAPLSLRNKVFRTSESIKAYAQKFPENNRLIPELNTSKYRNMYAQGVLFDRVFYNDEKDSITFFKNQEVTINNEEILVYFFKLKKMNKFSNPTSLHYIAFKKQDDSMLLKPYFRSVSRGIMLDETKSIDEMIDEALNLIRHKDRKRINSKRNYNIQMQH